MLMHPTHKEGEAQPFKIHNEELEHLQRKDSCLKKQRKIERLRTCVLGKKTHQHGESLDAISEPPAPKRPAPIELPTNWATVMLPD
jgi:hypothetical protein